ncbi:GlsB/YeaQ/YmgE family stress response membrane protein [Fictibacillus sp. Mic-4]|uniref:GlsB/YeaQ/YmgE family stress response membrane protein n=1 Tax=Fictibacillus TaxID=1329200 RepID=UPI0004225A61|nr:GlsB/YeaQ/YmgE family stress response membrane protein [Fictibacillus gelatini]
MELIWMIIVGGIIGWLGSILIGRDMPGGILGNIIAGFLGAWLGSEVLGPIGPVIEGFHIVPALLGAIIIVFIAGLVLRNSRGRF